MRRSRPRLLLSLGIMTLAASSVTACAFSLPAGIAGIVVALLLLGGLLFLGGTQTSCDWNQVCLSPRMCLSMVPGDYGPCLSPPQDGGDPMPDGGDALEGDRGGGDLTGGDPGRGDTYGPGDTADAGGHVRPGSGPETRLARTELEAERRRAVAELRDGLPADVVARIDPDDSGDEIA